MSKFSLIKSLPEEAFSTFDNENPLYELYFQSAVIRILCLMNEPKYNSYEITQKNNLLREILELINLECRSISSVNELSARIHYCNSYIHKIFRETMNITPYQFIVDKKLNEFKNASDKGCSVNKACDYVGFNNYANTITLFKKKYGITPKQYQLRMKKNDR